MSTNKYILYLLIVIISICAGTMVSYGENNTTIVFSNITTEPNVTVPSPTPIVNATTEPNVTVISPTPVVTPDVTTEPNATAPSPTPIVTPNVTIPSPTSIVTPNATVPVVTIDQNETRGTASNVTPEIMHTQGPTDTPRQDSNGTQASMPVVATTTPADSSGEGILGDFYDKIILAAILGFIGLIYEIAKIKYERKQKAKDEIIHEDVQNKLLEKLEKRQDELFAQTKPPSPEKLDQGDSLSKSEK